MIVKSQVNAYERLEIMLGANDRVDRMQITRPDLTVEYVYPFLYQPVDIIYDDEGMETVRKNGEMQTLCRYTPDITGEYIIKILSGENTVDTKIVSVNPSDDHGYVEVSKKDPEYFSYTDGTPFFSVGINTAFITQYGKASGEEFGLGKGFKYIGLRQYERWFKKCSQNGVNVARIWLGHEYFNPDTENTYEFDLVQFSKIDELIKLAKKYGIKLKLTIEQFRFFDYERTADSASYSDDIFRKFNKRLYDNGKRCESSEEWLKDERWGKAWLAKVGELAKRYSGDTAVFMIELWNEMNCVGKSCDVTEWNKKYLLKVKKMFKRQLVVNSLGSLDAPYVLNDCYKAFCWEYSDVIQMHRYIDQGAVFKVCNGHPIDMIKDGFDILPNLNKPRLLAETGAVNNCHSGPFRYYANDDRGIIFADTVYTPLFMKSCGTGNIWHWDERYVEAKNLYKMFLPIKKLVENVELDREGFECEDFSDTEVYALLLKGKNTVLGYIRNRSDSWQNVLRDLNEPCTVKEYWLPINGITEIGVEQIWEDESARVRVSESGLVITDLKYGLLFKGKFGDNNNV
ncbi:MAG: cellulase family glycosylhydrolase [Clostridia bacterium]|nr:cellulase family glycosylhydrolase [Clostridia bacterium]